MGRDLVTGILLLLMTTTVSMLIALSDRVTQLQIMLSSTEERSVANRDQHREHVLEHRRLRIGERLSRQEAELRGVEQRVERLQDER